MPSNSVKRAIAVFFAVVVTVLSVGLFVPASASVVSDVRGWCGYGGQDQTGCQPMIEANFPVPSPHTTQLFYDAVNPGSYYATMCFYSHGLMPEVQTSSGMWTAKQRDLCHAIALQVYHDNSLQVLIHNQEKVADANSFAGQMASCQKGIVVGVNPSSWLPGMWRWTTCMLKVAFVPTSISSVIDDTVDTKTHKKIPGLKTLMLSRVPFSYVVAGAVVVKNFISAYLDRSHPCVNGANTGVVSGSYALPGTTTQIALHVPCAPTGNIKALRGYLVAFIWLATGMGLWIIAQRSVMV